MEPSVRSLLRLQTSVSCALLAVVSGTFFGLWKVATDQPLQAWVERESLRIAEEDPHVTYTNRGWFAQVATRVFLEDIPAVDHRRGGVFFFGASNLVSGLRPWDWSESERGLVHNYGVAGTSLSQQAQMVDYLITYHDFLAGDPGDTFVVFLPIYGSAAKPRFFGKYFRDGLFRYGEEEGLHPVRMSALERALRVARVRVKGLLQLLPRTITVDGELRFQVRTVRPVARSREFMRQAFIEEMGEDWRADMASELERWERTLEFLVQSGAGVQVVLAPTASWQRELEYDEPFARGVESICYRHSIPFLDLREALPDSSYADHAHYNAEGTRLLDQRMMEIARRHLAQRGLLREE